MFTTRLIQLLLAALTVFSVSQALLADGNGRIVNREAEGIVKRQGTNPPPTSRSSTSPPPTSSSAPPTSSSNPPSSSPPPTSGSPTSRTPPPTSSSNSPSSEPPSSSDQPPSPTPTPTPSTITQVITSTNSDGKPTTLTSESVSTPAPTLSGQNGGTSTMSDTTRNTIIGVVVGVGGAIILAVVAFIAWRIWGRKKAVDQDDGMTSYSGPTEKVDGSSTTGRSPFQSTLESYHAPTQVNTASNF